MRKPQVPQHREKGGVELGGEARSRALMNAIGVESTEMFSATPPKSGPGVEHGPGENSGSLSDAIRAVKG